MFPLIKPMLAKPLNEAKLLKEVIVQPKYDGVRCLAYISKEEGVRLFSRNGNEYTSVPYVNKDLEVFLDVLDFAIIDGELYNHAMGFDEISGLARRKTGVSEGLEYHIFDTYMNIDCLRRIGWLYTLYSEFHNRLTYVKPVSSNMIDKESIPEALDIYLKKGFEGIIVRNPKAPYQQKRTYDLMKLKPMKTDIYKIVGFQEEVSIEGKLKDRLGAFICEKDGEVFTVGSGLEDWQRVQYWENKYKLIDKYIEVKYQNLTERGVPRFGVFLSVYNKDKL